MTRHFSRTRWVLWLLLLASIAIPATLMGLSILQSREQALREAETTAERTVLIIQRHAQNVFDTIRLVMDRVDDRLAGLKPDEIRASVEIHEFMAKVASGVPPVATILVIDADGNRINSSSQFSPPAALNIADRDYIRAMKAGYRGLYVAETVSGRRTGEVQIVIARARLTPQGGFDGVIAISASPGYFANFFRQIAPGMNHSAALVRADGLFIVRDAVAKPSSEQPRASDNFMRVSREGDGGLWTGISAVDGVQRVTAMRKLEGGLPVYAIFALGTDAVLARWREQVYQLGLFAIPAMLGLIGMSVLALVRTTQEQAATAQLNAEMKRREEAEAKLLHAQKLEALGTLTAGIAHDFNNILQVIMGSLDRLKRVSEDKRERLVDNALKAAEQGAKITSQLLAFGRRQPLKPEVTNLNTLLGSIDDMIAQTLKGSIELTFELADGLWDVELDRSQLQVALINVAANARDAMPDGGRVTIGTKNLAGQGADAGQSVSLSVSDTGMGISSSTLARLGEPFFSTKKEGGRGNGLGLAQVFGFVHQSGGSVDVRSEVNKGTTITFVFPRTTKARLDEAQVQDGPPGTEPGKLSILLVEDNLEVAEVASAMLSNLGHVVQHADCGDAALTILEKGARFDVLVSDLVMPGQLDGLALARLVRERWPALPTILVSGYSDAATQATREGFVLLPKPFSSTALQEALGRIWASLPAPEAANVIPLPRARSAQPG